MFYILVARLHKALRMATADSSTHALPEGEVATPSTGSRVGTATTDQSRGGSRRGARKKTAASSGRKVDRQNTQTSTNHAGNDRHGANDEAADGLAPLPDVAPRLLSRRAKLGLPEHTHEPIRSHAECQQLLQRILGTDITPPTSYTAALRGSSVSTVTFVFRDGTAARPTSVQALQRPQQLEDEPMFAPSLIDVSERKQPAAEAEAGTEAEAVAGAEETASAGVPAANLKPLAPARHTAARAVRTPPNPTPPGTPSSLSAASPRQRRRAGSLREALVRASGKLHLLALWRTVTRHGSNDWKTRRRAALSPTPLPLPYVRAVIAVATLAKRSDEDTNEADDAATGTNLPSPLQPAKPSCRRRSLDHLHPQLHCPIIIMIIAAAVVRTIGPPPPPPRALPQLVAVGDGSANGSTHCHRYTPCRTATALQLRPPAPLAPPHVTPLPPPQARCCSLRPLRRLDLPHATRCLAGGHLPRPCWPRCTGRPTHSTRRWRNDLPGQI